MKIQNKLNVKNVLAFQLSICINVFFNSEFIEGIHK